MACMQKDTKRHALMSIHYARMLVRRWKTQHGAVGRDRDRVESLVWRAAGCCEQVCTFARMHGCTDVDVCMYACAHA